MTSERTRRRESLHHADVPVAYIDSESLSERWETAAGWRHPRWRSTRLNFRMSQKKKRNKETKTTSVAIVITSL